jgi:hypothetical protein
MRSPLFFSLIFLGLANLAQAQDYNLEGPAWPAGAKVVMELGLGSEGRVLQDGTGSWNASAADACDIWNGYVDFITFSTSPSSIVPQVSGDGVNATFFADNVFGDDFGDLALAVAVYLSDDAQEIMKEADVVVNSAYPYDSYRGPEQSTVYDIHRILLHEFGHVLGLAHSGTTGGLVLMEPVISDVDHPFSDDIAGIRDLYGGSFYYTPGDATVRIGNYFIEDLYPNNNPTSFSATGLPPGIEIDSVTGRLSGTPNVSGVYDAAITAHGPIIDVSEGYRFTILGIEEVPGLLAILPLDVRGIVSDPSRPLIYTSGPDGVHVIDAETLEVSDVAAPGIGNAALSISADNSMLVYTNGADFLPQEYRVDLNSLTSLPPLEIPGNLSAVLEGLSNRAYVAGLHGVYQFDAPTGELQRTFAETDSTLFFRQMAISPDRRMLYVARDGHLASYDISTPIPTLVSSIPGSFFYPVPSPNGQFLYYVQDDVSGNQSAVRARLPSLAATATFTSSKYLWAAAIGLDGTVYQAVFPPEGYEVGDPSGFYSLFDPVTLQKTFDVPLGNLQAGLSPYLPLDGAFDNAGKYFFAHVEGFYGDDVWVFSTDLAAYPPPVHPTKNFVNISTRAHVETGEDAMIGGFIVQGPDPKKVLIRAIGPSLSLTGAMSDPVVELYDSSGKLLVANDDWKSDELNILGSLIPPSSDREAAVLMTLQPGAYTAIVHDSHNQPGVALVEVYDLDPNNSLLANISTRGKVESGDNVMIGGFVIGGEEPTQVLVRAIGPSLSSSGILQPLSDPLLELHDSSGNLISTNDNWRAAQETDIIATGIAPANDNESAILATLEPGSYTAIVRGQNYTTGVALVEVYNLETSAIGSK